MTVDAHSDIFEISIIVPVHNVAKYLPRCIDSLLAQTISNKMEIILVENGSTDNSLDVCHKYMAQYSNVKVLVSQKVGPGEARNVGIENAIAPLVAFVDADDYVSSDMYETLINAKKRYDADMVDCNYEIFHLDGSSEFGFDKKSGEEKISVCMSTYNVIIDKEKSYVVNRIFNRSFFDNRRFPEGRFFEDSSILFKWVSECKSIYRVYAPFYKYCVRKGSTTQTQSFKVQNDFLESMVERLRFMKNYRGLNREQYKKATRSVIKICIKNIKFYIWSLTYKKEQSMTYDEIYLLSRVVANNCLLPVSVIGCDLWIRVWRIKYMWKSYYKKHLG